MSNSSKAMYLLTKGIQTIPLNSNKTPIVSFKDIAITNDFINEYKHIYDNTSALGVLTRGVWCIDIDIKPHMSKNGLESLKEIPFYKEIVTNAKATYVQTTGTGGKHLIFKKRPDINYSQKIGYLENVDIKANDNNYFVLAGSETQSGKYTHNNVPIKYYDGNFEKRIFTNDGNYHEQAIKKYSLKNVMHDYNFDHLKPFRSGKGGKGKQAYQRIINGQSEYRNEDLYKAVSYATACNVDIEPLRVLIGDNKAGDVMTLREWEGTVRSGSR